MRNVAAFMDAPPSTLSAPPNAGGTAAPIRSSNESAATLKSAKAENSIGKTAAPDESEGKAVLNDSVVILAALLIALWVLGGIVFKSANL